MCRLAGYLGEPLALAALADAAPHSLYRQSYAAKEGKSPVEALKAKGLTIVDWTDLGAFMGYWIERTHARHIKEYTDTMEKVRKKYEAAHPGVKPDLDIQF